MTLTNTAVRVVRCPLTIDRRATGGWFGDPVSRYTRCEFTVAYVPGSWWTYPNGRPHENSEPAERAMQSHLSDHPLTDIEATTRKKSA